MESNMERTGPIEAVLNALKEIFRPIIPAITAAGMLQGIFSLILLSGILDQGSDTYIILNSLARIAFDFLPILVAASAAKYFGSNQYISICLMLLFFYPDMVELLGGEKAVSLFGLPVLQGSYKSSVIPAILIVWAQKYIEKFTRWLLPDLVDDIFGSMLDLLITGILAVLVLGLLGLGAGYLLGSAIQALGNIASWLVPTVLGGFGIFAVISGGHYPLFPVMFDQYSQLGYENFFAAGMLATNIGLAGAILATMLKTDDTKTRKVCLTSFITAILGTTQPGIFGIALKFSRVMKGAMLAGFLGGFFAGVVNFVSYSYVNPGLLALPVYLGPNGDVTNLIKGLITMLIAFAVAFVYTFMGSDEDFHEEDGEIEYGQLLLSK